MKNNAFFAILVILCIAPLFAATQAAGDPQNTLVVINSPYWQDAFIAAQYAHSKGHKFKFVTGIEDLQSIAQEIYGMRVSGATIFQRRSASLPALLLSIRSLGIRVKDVSFSDHHELAEIILKETRPSEAVLVRDDFAFDAISSTYLLRTRRAGVAFSEGTAGPLPGVVRAMRDAGVKKVYALGDLKGDAYEALQGFEVIKFRGRDQYEASRLANAHAFETAPPGRQSIITTGDILENTVLFAHEFPVFVVPEYGSYSLPALGALLNKYGQIVTVGVGQSVLNAGEFLRENAKLRSVLKITKLKTPGQGSAFERRDLLNILPGYKLSVPNYSFELSSVNPDYTDLLGLETGHAVFFELADKLQTQKPAPPVTLRATIINNGNIEIQVNVLFRILDLDGNPLATVDAGSVTVRPKEAKVARALWANPPSEGTYSVRAEAFADVYEGITQTKTAQFDLSWLAVILNLLFFVLLMAIVVVITYYSRKLGRRHKEATTSIDAEFEKLRTRKKP